MRRFLDVVVSMIALLVLSIPFLVIGILVKLTSPGPVFYSQERIGLGGKSFPFHKFRTMRTDLTGTEVTAADDRRITAIGSVLRRWKIDELPQLWNILRGDMSIVGPRPEVERFVRVYTPGQKKILDQTPGLASISQLTYYNESQLLMGHADPERIYVEHLLPRKIAMDLAYEARRTFLTDLGLISEVMLLLVGVRLRKDTQIEEELARAKQSGVSAPGRGQLGSGH